MFFFFGNEKELSFQYDNVLKHYTNEPAILIGNGINLLSDNRSWEHLLRNISEHFQINVRITRDKAFPLIFEELLFKSNRTYNETLDDFKQRIYNELIDLKNNEFHNRLMEINCNEYLTTNYDYSLERVLQTNFEKNNTNSKEIKYSIYRNNVVGEIKKIWHIHGELDQGSYSKKNHNSILIGNEHYGDYHKRIIENIKPKDSIVKALENERKSWPQMFFTHDIHIIGLSMDFSENHLWWLINYRARIERIIGELPNKIYYHYPSFSEEQNRAKNELFSALNVESVPTVVQTIDDNKYKRFWDILLTRTLPNLINKNQ